jgi:signal transduction histidine kinase
VLTQQLLAFARRQPLAPETVDLNRLVRGMSELLHRTLGEIVEIETVLAGGLWPVSVDVSQLESAIVNLSVNARDAMLGGGKLTIETANSFLDESYANAHDEVRPGQYVLLAISDSGVGMSKEVLEQAFDPFSRPRRSARVPGSACRRSTGSSSSRVDTSKSTASRATGRR